MKFSKHALFALLGIVGCLPVALSNDLCADAIDLDPLFVGGSVTVSGDTSLATPDGAGFCGTSDFGAPGVWYKFTPDSSTDYTFSTCNQASYDTKIFVFEGTCGGLICVGGNDDSFGCSGFSSELTIPCLVPGTEYFVLVSGFSSTSMGLFDLTVTKGTVECLLGMDHDQCSDAVELIPDQEGLMTALSETTTATFDNVGLCGTDNTAPGVWFTFVTGNANRPYSFSTCDQANFDTKISVFRGNCNNLVCVDGLDDSIHDICGAGSTLFFTEGLRRNTRYYVLVHGFASQTGDFNLVVEPLPEVLRFPGTCVPLPKDRFHGETVAGWQVVPFCDPFGGGCDPHMNAYADMDLEFEFRFLGEVYTSVRIDYYGSIYVGNLLHYLDVFYTGGIDLGGFHQDNGDHVYYKSWPEGFAVAWDHVSPANSDEHNSFQIVLSKDPWMEGNNNVCYCYGDMQWPGASVGVWENFAFPIPYTSFIGSFTDTGDHYSPPNTGSSGVGFLEGNHVCFNTESTDIPPIFLGPVGGTTLEFYLIPVQRRRRSLLSSRGSKDAMSSRLLQPDNEVFASFYFIPGSLQGRIVEVVVVGDYPPEMIVSTTPVGNSFFVYVSWEDIYYVEPFEVEFTAYDDSTPPLTTTKILKVEVEGEGDVEFVEVETEAPTTLEPVEEIVETQAVTAAVTESPTTETPTTVEPTDSPTPDDGICQDKYNRWFYVDYLDTNKDCIWLSNRYDDMERLCRPDHPAYHICEDTCGKCVDCDDADDSVVLPPIVVDASQQLVYGMTCSILADRPRDQPQACLNAVVREVCPDTCHACPTAEPTTVSPTSVDTELIVITDTQTPTTVEPVCDDARGVKFPVLTAERNCAWLKSKLDDLIQASNEFPQIPSDWIGLTWGEALCGDESSPGVAYDICSETCGQCEDDCHDARVFSDFDGNERTCEWLSLNERNIDLYCNNGGATAAVDCAETCGTCD